MSLSSLKILLCVCLCPWFLPALGQKKMALVIGNADYKHMRPLNNPVHDAKSVDSFLHKHGFEVQRFYNLENRDAFSKVVHDFCSKIKPNDVTLFYYSGHGIQIQNVNYLIPTKSKLSTEDDVIDNTFSLNRLLEQFQYKRSRLNMVMLDACRDNPLPRNFRGTKGLQGGLTPPLVSFTQETLISFATECNRTAADGEGYHSPYTESFLEAANRVCTLLECFAEVTDLVRKKTKANQSPWKMESLGAEAARFSFIPKNCMGAGVRPPMLHWKMMTAWSEECRVTRSELPDMVAELNDKLKGRLHIELVPAPERFTQMFHAVTRNEVQLLHGSAYYWKEQIPAAPFFASIPFGMNHDEFERWMKAEGQKLYEQLYEQHGIRPFLCGHTGQQAGGWFNKIIRDTHDLKHMWIRMPGLGGKVLESFGVRVHSGHAKDVYSFLKGWDTQKGAEFTGPCDDLELELDKISTYCYLEGWQEPNAAYTLLANQSAFEQLDPATQALFEAIVSKYNERIYNQYLMCNRANCKKLKERNLQFATYPAPLKQILLNRTAITLEKYVQEPNCTHCPKIWESYQKSLPNHQLTLRDFNVCQD